MTQVLAILASVGAFLDNKLVRRLCLNLSALWHTPVIAGTEIDGWVIGALYGTEAVPPENRRAVVEAKLEKIQSKVDAMTPDEKAVAQIPRALDPPEVLASRMPWMEASASE